MIPFGCIVNLMCVQLKSPEYHDEYPKNSLSTF